MIRVISVTLILSVLDIEKRYNDIAQLSTRQLLPRFPFRTNAMQLIGAPIVSGMIASTIRQLIAVQVFLALMKEEALRRKTSQPQVPELHMWKFYVLRRKKPPLTTGDL